MAQPQGKLNILPVDVAEEIKACSEAAAQSTANERYGSQGEADAQKVHWNEHAASFVRKSDGLLSKEICSDIKMMFWFEAWRTANERKGYDGDAADDKKKVASYFKSIKDRAEMTDQLATDIRNMGWNSAWYWANTLYGYDDDAKRDKAKLEADYNKIHGDINLVDMKFFTDKAKTLTAKPKVIAEQTLPNYTDLQQGMTFQFSTSRGTTTSVSTTVGFKFTISSSIEVGFEGFGKASLGFSAELSSSTTLADSLSKGETKTYTFPLVVPPHTTYTAKGMVNEANMDVPYELVFDFGGTRKSIYGTWKGVAVSTATYVVKKVSN